MNYKEIAKEIRLNCLKAVKESGKGHLGGTFSIIDVLVVLYYGGFLRFNQKSKLERDRVIIGKGHANLAFFYIWNNLDLLSLEELQTYGKDKGLGGQIDTSIFVADNITGSLGHAIGVASGISLANKMNKKDYKAIAIVGDGEMEEGSIWESLDFAFTNKLGNLLCIVDKNNLSVTDTVKNNNLFNKVKTFGWNVLDINGHNYSQIYKALKFFFSTSKRNKPLMIITNTIKGKGVSFMENNVNWHHGGLTDKQYEIALKELND